MELSIPTDAPLTRQIRFQVPAAEVAEHYREALRSKAKNARIPGFRPGKVPMPVVERQFGRQALLDAIDTLINEHYAKALRSHELRPVARPEIQIEQGNIDQDLIFTASLEVYPEFEPTIPRITLKRQVATISDADVDRTVTIMRQQRQSYQSVARAAKPQDRVILDFQGKIQGEPFAGGTMVDYPVLIGAGRLLPEMENALLGMVAGEEKDVAVPFPPDYPVADLAGKTADFHILVKEIAEPILPALDADFAKALGIDQGGVDQLLQEVRENLEREARRISRQRLKAQLLDAMLEANAVPVPKALLEQEEQRQRQGQNMGDLTKEQQELIAKRVRLGLILTEIARQQQLQPSPRRMEETLLEMSEQYENPREFMAWYRKDRERMETLASMVLEEQVVDWLLERVTVEDENVEFQELIGRRLDEAREV
ncbi:MAG: trigger factor [Acidithiobacillus sp.]|nr:trigger factor [Acidithiobacillus sp.]